MKSVDVIAEGMIRNDNRFDRILNKCDVIQTRYETMLEMIPKNKRRNINHSY